MKDRIVKTRFRLMSFVLLISILLSACSQSISRNGESIDSIYAQEAGAAEENNDRDVIGQLPEREQQPADRDETEPEDSKREDVVSNAETAPDLVVKKEEDTKATNEPSRPVQTTDDKKPQQEPVNQDTQKATAADPPPAEAAEPPPTPPADKPSKPETQQEQLEWDGDNTLTFSELYASVGVRGIVLSDKVEALTGKEVEMSGFMAPPLTAGVRFFVLTKALMAVCPFCSTDADWPTDIVVVYLPDGEELQPTEHPVRVTGRLDTGSYTDEDTGFVSLVRIYADKVEVLK